MIAYIKGIVAEIEKDGIVLESQNMGYRIFMPASSLERLGKTGEERMIHTYLHVKEDAMQLYGFIKKEDLAVFRLLLGVNGVGPKGAMGILSCLSGEGLSFAILSDDAAAIAKAPGIGKKTAQKVILELKDKMNLQEAFEQKISGGEESDRQKMDSAVVQEAAAALEALGYGRQEAWSAVRRVSGGEGMNVEELLRAALKEMV